MAVTLEKIAERANVSITTVSKVINDRASEVGIKLETQKRILEIIKELNYYPDSSARSLRLRKSHTLGVVAGDMRELYYGDILTGVEKEAKSTGYFCMLSTVEEDVEREQAYLRMFRQRRVDGILIIGAQLELGEENISQLASEDIPVVFIAKKTAESSVPFVVVDNQKGGLLATEHLIELGHRRIAFIKGIIGQVETVESRERYEGYCSALKKHHLSCDGEMIEIGRGGTSGLDSGYECTTKLLSRLEPPTAIFAFDDLIGMGTLKAIRDKRLKVPGDISVVGFDNIALAAYSDPPLTTIGQPMVEMGRRGAKILINIIEKGRKDITARSTVLQPRLIVRESTGLSRMVDR